MRNAFDRNPSGMLRYAKRTRETTGNIILVVRGIEGVLDSVSARLDEISQKNIRELHLCCSEFLKQIDVYSNLADEIEKNAKKIEQIQSNFKGHQI